MLPTHRMFKYFTALFFASMISASLSYAAGPGDRGRPQGPPPEAIEACADLSKGDDCSFTGRRKDEVKGTCIVMPDDDDEGLACAPEGGPPRERGRSE